MTRKQINKIGTEKGSAMAKGKIVEPEQMRLGVTTGTANMLKYLAVTANDRVVIVTDKETLPVGEGIQNAIRAAGAKAEFIIIEDLGERPLTSLPPDVEGRIRALEPTVSFYAAAMKDGELPFRKALIGLLVGTFHVRHAHMPGITAQAAGGEAMCADPIEIAKTTKKVYEIVKNAKNITITTPKGTNLTIELDQSQLHWHPSDGMLTEQGKFGNVPGGEVFTTPSNVNGTFVTNLLGDHFTKKYGVLKTPVTVEIKDGYAVSVSCSDKALEAEVREYLFRGENTNRVGELGLGTNTWVTMLIGNMLVDEKAVGVHLAFGDPLGDHTGATWKVTPIQHCDMVTQGTTILVDGKEIMKNGKYLI